MVLASCCVQRAWIRGCSQQHLQGEVLAIAVVAIMLSTVASLHLQQILQRLDVAPP
jgi:hypothetical protein